MAGDWIKMRKDLADDPDVLTIAHELGVNMYTAIGMLHKFWSWADAHTTDGHQISVEKSWINKYINKRNFVKSLEKVGWLAGEDWALEIPNFERHNGESAKRRSQDAKRKQKQRIGVQEMSRTNAETTVTREEKRREEESRDKNTTGAKAPAGDIVLVFNIKGKEGPHWVLLQSKLDEYKSTYPNLDVVGELLKARQWLVDSPTRRKTARGMPSFLNGWLSRQKPSEDVGRFGRTLTGKEIMDGVNALEDKK